MIPQQDKYIDFVNRTLDKEIFIRKTGKKEINMVAHAHEKYQIVYTFMGTIHVQIEGTSYFVPEKHIAWIPSRMVHEISSNNRQVSLVIFYMALGEVADEDVKRQFAIYNTNTMIAGNLKFIASKGPMINGEQEASLFDFSLAFFRLLPLVVPKSEILLKTLVIPNDPRLLPILDYMKNHVCESLTIERVAHEYGLSVRSLSRLFNGSGICFSILIRLIFSRALDISGSFSSRFLEMGSRGCKTVFRNLKCISRRREVTFRFLKMDSRL